MRMAAIIRMVMLAVLWWSVLFLLPCSASQKVVVDWPLLPNQQETEVRKDVLAAGFVQGVVQQANELLAMPLEEERARVFTTYIQDQVPSLVLGYSITRTVKHEDPPALVTYLSVTVNIPALKTILKQLGILYTSVSPVPTTITLSGMNATDWQRIEALQTLTGIDMASAAAQQGDVQLGLIKSGTSKWEGTLNAFDKRFSSQGVSLEKVWLDLWQQYFELEDVVEGTFAKVRLTIHGWYVPEGVSYFDTLFRSWKHLVEEAHILSVDLQTEGLSSTWEVRTPDVNALRDRLETVVPDKGLRLVSFKQP